MLLVLSMSNCAEIGRLDAEPLCRGPNIYGSLQLRIKASLRAQVAEDKLNAPLPRFMPDYSC